MTNVTLHTKHYNFQWYLLPNNSSSEYRTSPKPWHLVYLLLLYDISISWLNLLNGERFYFFTCVIIKLTCVTWKPPIVNCWRAVARQLSILYNSEIWPKSVGCKIVDLRSRMPSLYPGACGFGDMRSRFLYIRDMLVNAHGSVDRNSSNSRNQGHVKRWLFLNAWSNP